MFSQPLLTCFLLSPTRNILFRIHSWTRCLSPFQGIVWILIMDNVNLYHFSELTPCEACKEWVDGCRPWPHKAVLQIAEQYQSTTFSKICNSIKGGFYFPAKAQPIMHPKRVCPRFPHKHLCGYICAPLTNRTNISTIRVAFCFIVSRAFFNFYWQNVWSQRLANLCMWKVGGSDVLCTLL